VSLGRRCFPTKRYSTSSGRVGSIIKSVGGMVENDAPCAYEPLTVNTTGVSGV
jgi:hypothetical protein